MLDQRIIDLARGVNYAVITTLLPDGTPHSNVMWVDTDGEHILMNTEIHRQKFRNIQSDPRVTVVIVQEGDPYHWAEVRGRVTEVIGGQQARDHIDDLSMKYFGRHYTSPIRSERAILKIAPDRESVHIR
jgi:PPOX class probable F420-dependent enzyme